MTSIVNGDQLPAEETETWDSRPHSKFQATNPSASSSSRTKTPRVDTPKSSVKDGNRPKTKKQPAGTKANIEVSENGEPGKIFPRLSIPVELMGHQYDVVVIGSGYGGGVAASRMARGGQSVCLLELGKEKWPGEYPSTLENAAPEIHVTGHLTSKGPAKWINTGDQTGLYRLVLGEGQNAFMANGLGGTSLLNANVFMRADEKTVACRLWPKEIRHGGLDKYYDRAESVLQPAPYPEDFPPLLKLKTLEEQAKKLGWGDKFRRVNQTTRFVDGPNSTGVEMNASTLTGMDCTGINDGSKSTTLVTYLSDAWNWGTEIFCECEVRHIKPHPKGEGYIVYFAWHGSKRATFKNNFYSDLMWVHAKKFVFLGAGSLGTTEILLRSKEVGLKMSERVGTTMSGNGDILAFGYNTDLEVNAIGREVPLPDLPIGPTINGVIDCRDQENFLDGFVIEEGAVPGGVASLFQSMLQSTPGKIDAQNFGLQERLRHLVSRSKSRLLGPYVQDGSVERTQIYLIMSHDDNQAILSLKDDKPSLQFLGVGRSDHVQHLNHVLAEATSKIGGTYINSPFYALLGQDEITVHAIGGANMSSDGSGTLGATNHKGQLLKGFEKDCHKGIVMVDGSVVPLALGANPFATITALAERSVEKVAQESGIKIDYETKNGILNLFGRPAHPHPSASEDESLQYAQNIIKNAEEGTRNGIEFTEVMEGNLYTGDDIDDFEIATRAAIDSGDTARFYLSAHAWDTDSLLSRTDHPALLTGSMTCRALSRDPFMVLRGNLQLFNQDFRSPDTTDLTYDFDMVSTTGEAIHFNGYKTVNESVAFSPWAVWKAASTIYVTLTDSSGARIARGTLHTSPSAFEAEARTITSTSPSLFGRIKSSSQFLSFLAMHVLKSFIGPLNPLQWPSSSYSGYIADKVPPAKTMQVTASDGVETTLRMWNPATSKGPQPAKARILMIPSVATDHQIFALPTIRRNAVEYFTAAGHEVFVITHRIGKTILAEKGYTTFDARLDIKAALEEIRNLQDSPENIYIIAHGEGSMALSMALLDGTIPASWIKGITASNVFMHPKFTTTASSIFSFPRFYKAIAGSWFSCTSTPADPFTQRTIDQALRFYPVGGVKEMCNSVVCHRASLVFGRLYTHAYLNADTHNTLSRLLGGISVRNYIHIARMAHSASHAVTNNENASLVTPQNLENLKGVPILLFSGADNRRWSPESTDISYNTLRDALGEEGFERAVWLGKGDLDCWIGEGNGGVLGRVRGHLDGCGRGEDDDDDDA